MKALGLSVAFASLLGFAPLARADKACENACNQKYPRKVFQLVQRKGCQATCWARDRARDARRLAGSAVKTAKKVGGKIVKTAKKVGEKVVDAAKAAGGKLLNAAGKVVRGLWDKAKKCVADGLGGCVRRVISAAGQIVKGLWDKAKKCFADGLGGCLKKIAKGALELACKGVGIFWDKAKNCCKQKGAVACMKEAAVWALRKGARWLCQKGAPTIVPLLNKAGAWLLNKAGAALRGYKLSLSGSEIGALACAFKAAIGKTISNVSRRFGDPVLTIRDITLGGVAERSRLIAPLGATASISVPGKSGALSVRLEGEVDLQVDTQCNFEGPLATVGARVTKVGIGSIPQWLTDTAVQNFVNPSLGCFTFCPPQIKAAGMDVSINYCKVVDTCLKNNCTAPVVNTIIDQVFPISMPLAPMLPQKPALENVRREIQGWGISIGGVRFRTNPRDPYRPSITASVAIGPGGRPKFNVQATGTLRIETFCRSSGESMIKVTPSLALKLGDVPKWMGEITLPNIANRYITDFANSRGGVAGRFAIRYPSFLSGKSAPPPKEASVGPGLVERLKQNSKAILSVVQTALAGRFKGDRQACDRIPGAGGDLPRPAGGACVLCLKGGGQGAPSTPAAGGVEAEVGHITGERVRFRAGPSQSSKTVALLPRCTEVEILDRRLEGENNFWSHVRIAGRAGYVARQYLQRGPATVCAR